MWGIAGVFECKYGGVEFYFDYWMVGGFSMERRIK